MLLTVHVWEQITDVYDVIYSMLGAASILAIILLIPLIDNKLVIVNDSIITLQDSTLAFNDCMNRLYFWFSHFYVMFCVVLCSYY